MRLPAPLLRNKKNVHKNNFGHVFVLAGSRHMMGAAGLITLAAMRSGAGLTTLGVPKSLNTVAQKKIPFVVMSRSLKETPQQTLSLSAYKEIAAFAKKCTVMALGPGLSQNKSTQKLILKIYESVALPTVVDADALNALASNKDNLHKNAKTRILTPHPGEMARLTGFEKSFIEKNRKTVAADFARKNQCTVVLKGHKTVIAHQSGKITIQEAGNSGMATAGSGDVLTGIIAAFLAQGLSDYEAAKWGVLVHGRAGNRAAEKRSKTSLIASDIIDSLADIFK